MSAIGVFRGRIVWALGAVAILPFVYLLILIRTYMVDVPYWDQWTFVPLLDQSYTTGVTLADVWAQYNEHRLLFPRLIMLVLAHLTGWNVAYELATNLMLALGTALVMMALLRQLFREVGDATGWFAMLPIVTVQVFSPQQYENWLWGWQIQIFLNVLAVVVGIACLTRPTFHWSNLVGACVAGVVALYSFASGISYWLLGLPVLILMYPHDKRRWWVRGFWVILGGLAIGSYLYDYQSVSEHPAVSFAWQHPLDYARYVLTYLGAPVAGFSEPAALGLGLLNLVGFTGLSWSLLKRDINVRHLLPLMALSAYSISAALVTGIGRAGFGSAQAMSPRYVTLAYFLGLTNSVFLYIWWRTRPASSVGWAAKIQRGALGLVTGVVIVIFTLSVVAGTGGFLAYHANLVPARAELHIMENSDLLSRLFPNETALRERVEILKQHHLSVFREADP